MQKIITHGDSFLNMRNCGMFDPGGEHSFSALIFCKKSRLVQHMKIHIHHALNRVILRP